MKTLNMLIDHHWKGSCITSCLALRGVCQNDKDLWTPFPSSYESRARSPYPPIEDYSKTAMTLPRLMRFATRRFRSWLGRTWPRDSSRLYHQPRWVPVNQRRPRVYRDGIVSLCVHVVCVARHRQWDCHVEIDPSSTSWICIINSAVM